MSTASGKDAAFELLDARTASVDKALDRVSRAWAGKSQGELIAALSTADRKDRPMIGLILARVIAQSAAVTGSPTQLKNFLFRFGMHLSASVGTAGSSANAVVVAIAARTCLQASSAAEQAGYVDDVLARLPDVAVSEKRDAWRRQLGMTQPDFDARVETVAAVARPAARRRPHGPAPARTPRSGPAAGDAVRRHERPSWLTVDHVPEGAASPGSTLASTRSWPVSRPGTAAPVDDARDALDQAWQAFKERRFAFAEVALAPLLDTAGWGWTPSTSPDGLRMWNWLRLAVLCSQLDSGAPRNRRRALVSAVDAITRCLPAEEELSARLLQEAVEDFITVEPRSRAAWATYLARLVTAVDAEDALAYYDNARRAELRQAWAERFGALVEGCTQTHQMIEALSSELRHAAQAMVEAHRQPEPHRALTRPLRRLAPFLDEEEAELAAAVERSAETAAALLPDDSSTATDLIALREVLEHLQEDVAGSASLLMQDSVGPALQRMHASVSGRVASMVSASRPHVAVALDTDRLPLSSLVAAPFTVRTSVRNDGNRAAELVELALTCDALALTPETRVLQRLEPGQQLTVEWTGQVVATTKGTSILCRAEWRDVLEQQFAEEFAFPAEDQRPTSWRSDDVNPFHLGTISEPRSLVGRDRELAALERTVAGGGSAYVTGQKRVGKTSLVKVLQRRLTEDGWLTAHLPLGVALAETERAADVVLAILEAVYDESLQFPDLTLPEPPGGDVGEQVARAVGRWIRQASAPMEQAGVRVLVALDDFDTLPPSLYRGATADALFRTLRTLVDVPWLSLIFVGSEVLPTILAAQAHQLNQVARFPVTNFSSPEDTQQLLTSRTADRVDWDGRAFARAHFLCAGNPYYLTLMGRELWQHLRERDRSYVAIDDVEWSLRTVASQGDPSHFLHLWADNPNGLETDSRRSLLASAFLRATAKASGPRFANVELTEAVTLAAQWVPSATGDEWRSTSDSLAGREVLVMSGQRKLRLAVPLASAWLEGAGALELDRQYAAAENARVATQMIPPREIVDLTNDLTFCGERVSDLRLRSWLDQFDPGRPRHLAFLLARRLLADGFFTSARLTSTLLPELAAKIKGSPAWSVRSADSRNVYLLQHGMAASSSPGFTAQLLGLLKVRKANLIAQDDFVRLAAKKPCIVVVADDVAGTGGQLKGVTEGLTEALDRSAQGWRETVHVVVAAALSAQDPLWLPEGAAAHSVVAHQAAPRLMAFHPDAGIFDNDADREAAEEIMRGIGLSLLPEHPLGYGGLGLVVATENNCPNNTLPVFWRPGTYGGHSWLPLLPRRV